MATPVTIEEYEEEARKKLPDYVWDYYHSGASNLLMRTAVANIQAYSRSVALRSLTGAGVGWVGEGVDFHPFPLHLVIP